MRAIFLGLLIALAGCTPATNEPAAAAPAAPEAAKAAPAPAPAEGVAPPAAPPAPAAAPATPDASLVQGGVDYACATAADCAVKNVGSCCGQQPQCVNKDSPVFPEQVRAQCAQEGRSSVCGFQEIASCDCIEGRCTGVAGAGGSGELQQD